MSAGRAGTDRSFLASLDEADPEIAALIAEEEKREESVLDMVAAENFAPRSVLEAQGSILTNKYADGYPARRDYDGCEVVDEIEQLAVDRATALFGAEHANVQPYSGSSANEAVLHALCAPGDAILGLDFAHGGHPTHHDAATFAGRFYAAQSYHVREHDRIVDMDEVARLAAATRPAVILAGWSCYTRHLDFAAFRAIADDCGAYLVVDMAHFAGLVAGRCHPDPVPYADACTLTVHKTLGGPRGGAIVCRGELAERVDAAVYPGHQGGPLLNSIAGKATTFHLCATAGFAERMARTIAGARTIAAVLAAEAPATGCAVVTGGTDTHQVLLDTAPGPLDAGRVLTSLHRIGVSANAMRIAFDPEAPPSCSGVRLGTTSLATRGFGLAEFKELGEILAAVLGPERERLFDELAERVRTLAHAHPAYPGR